MPSWAVPLADVVVPESDLEVVARTYRSGWLSMGPETEALEQAFATYTGAKHALAVTNGTAALHLICAAAGLGPGDEVVVPSLTFVATVNAVVYTGATPVFADIVGLDAPWLSPQAAERAITPRTKAIMSVVYGGHPGETSGLVELARARGVLLLEDAAHAAGSRHGRRHLGTLGDAGAFSLFSNKNLAVGEGGMVVTDEDALAERLRLLRSHGMTTLTWDRHRGHASSYDVVALGFNYRIDEPRAALARQRLSRLDEENIRRGKIIARYRAELAGIDALDVVVPPPPGAGYHLFTVLLGDDVDRDQVRSALASRGIQTSVHYPPAHRFSIYQDLPADLPLTDAYAARCLTLPLFAHMSDAQLELVLEALSTALPSSRLDSASR